ncbi:MAG: respiratory nitrate reductase subunit gamma [Candidatus Riflebacteria bacterium]|nr:respiratory nitrate reductase subunit gamma [Candidatus Riflebacteria bacterium]
MTLLAFCYLAVGFFAVAFVHRAWAIASMPVHLRWELAPVPHEASKAHYGGSYLEEYEWWTKPREKSLVSEGIYMFKEIVLLRGVWEHNPRMWTFSFPFHFGIYLLVAMAGCAFLAAWGLPLFGSLARMLAILGYCLGCLGTAGLLYMRLADPKLSAFTTPATCFNLLFLFLVFSTGAYSVFGLADFTGELAKLMKAFFTIDTTVALPAAARIHVVAAAAFLVYLPFTHMLHFLAKYFTYHEIRWNDEPMTAGSAMEAEVKALLSQPVEWAAPHIGADGKKNWVDVATQEVQK